MSGAGIVDASKNAARLAVAASLGASVFLTGCGGPELGTDPCTGERSFRRGVTDQAAMRREAYWYANPSLNAEQACAASRADAAARREAEAAAAVAQRRAARLATTGTAPAGQAATSQPNSDKPPPQPEATPRPVALTSTIRGRICRATIASIMGRDPNIIRVVSNSGEVVRVRYTRDDGTVWNQQCRVSTDGQVTWAGIENGRVGRWRTEDAISYTVEAPNRIRIRQSSMGELLDDSVYTVR